MTRHRFLRAGLCLAALAIGAPSAAAELPDFGGLLAADRKVEVYAERVTREQDTKTTTAEGAVDIQSGRVRLRADRVVLNDVTMDLTATGNVVLEAGDDRLQGEYLEFNLNTEVGFVSHGQGFAQAYYFTGERIEKLSEDTYHILRGRFTSCEGVLPDWSFHSPDTTIQVNHYIHSWHPSAWVKKVPVFYLPYGVFPIKRDRATGLLVPRARYNQGDGLIVENAFFWAPVDFADLTVMLDYISERGMRYGLETNYVLGEDTYGKADGTYIRDRKTRSNRWEFNLDHRQDLPLGFSGLVNIESLSDSSFDRDYGVDLEDLSRERIYSFGSVSREWADQVLTFSGERTKSLATDTTDILERFPEVNYSRQDTTLGGPVLWSLKAQGVGLRHEKDETVKRTTRIDLNPKVSVPVNVRSWATVKPSLELDWTWWSRDLEDETHGRFIWQPRLELTGPRVYRIWGEQGEGPMFKHLITPRLTWNYRPDVDQENILRFDGKDRISADNSLTYGLTTQVFGKFTRDDGTSRVVELLRLDLSQVYRLDVASGTEEEGFGNIVLDVDALPWRNLSLYADARYDVREGEFLSTNYGLDWFLKDRLSVGLERRFSKQPEVDYVEGSTQLTAGRWKLGYRGRYDLVESAFVENWYETTYKAQCWDVTVTYVDRQDGYEFRLLLNLKEIGTILKI